MVIEQEPGANLTLRLRSLVAKIRERLVVTPRSTPRSCRSMSSYGRVLAARSKPVYFFRSNLC